MILRSNIQQYGVDEGPELYQGAYAAYFENNQIAAVAAHYNNGNMFFFAPKAAGELAAFLAQHTKRPVMGLIGPWADCIAALDHLGLRDRTIDQPPHQEILYDLNLADLRIPRQLSSGAVGYRLATLDDAETLIGWRIDYELETIRYERTPTLEERVRKMMLHTIGQKSWWVATLNNTPVAMSSFNARLSDMAQVGGVHTPQAHRGKGYARVVVAGSLMDARAKGVSTGILFTEITNIPAQKVYEALGFKRIGDYALLMMRPD
jgi:RimJ/RimL family protein N-acetyltransferase